MDKDLFTIVQYGISILIVIVFRYLIPYVSLKLKDEKYANLLSFIAKAVNAAESIYKETLGSGEQKKNYVINKIKDYIKKNNIKITDEQIDLLIQAIFTELDGRTINTCK